MPGSTRPRRTRRGRWRGRGSGRAGRGAPCRAGRHRRLRLEVVGRQGSTSVTTVSHLDATVALASMAAPYAIRIIGDPVLRQRADRGHRHRRHARPSGRGHDRDACTRPPASAWPPRRSACRSGSSSTTSTTTEGPQVLVNPVDQRDRGEWVYEEGCLSVPGLLVGDRPAEGDPPHRLRPRRQRGLDRGRRAAGPGVPARARPPRRRPAPRAARRRPAQGGQAGRPRAPAAGRRSGATEPAPHAAEPRRAPARASSTSARPEAAVPPLRALVAAGHDVAARRDPPDRRRGRGGALSPSPVKAAAARARPARSPTGSTTSLDAGAELGVVVAFGRLIKPHVLDALPMVNLHFSLLPRWRGAAPVERAILAGDDETGVCLMAVEEGLDTGPVYACERGADRRRRDAPTSCASRLVAVGTGPARRPLDGRPRRADARRRASPPTPTRSTPPSSSSTGPGRPTSSTAWCASAGRGRRSGASGSRCCGPDPAARSTGRPGTLDGPSSPPAPAASSCVEVQPEGKGRAGAQRGVAQRRPARRPASASGDVTARGPTARTARALELAPTSTRGRLRQPRARRDASNAAGSTERDRAFVTELVYGTTRMRRACDCLVDRFVLRDARPADPRPPCGSAPTSSTSSGTPPHAAVSAPPSAVGPGRARGLVNAVLRRVADAPVELARRRPPG